MSRMIIVTTKSKHPLSSALEYSPDSGAALWWIGKLKDTFGYDPDTAQSNQHHPDRQPLADEYHQATREGSYEDD